MKVHESRFDPTDAYKTTGFWLIFWLTQNHWFSQAAALEAAGLQPNLLPEPAEPAEDEMAPMDSGLICTPANTDATTRVPSRAISTTCSLSTGTTILVRSLRKTDFLL